MANKKYYEAYDDRYKQVHAHSLHWFHDCPSPIVTDVISTYQVTDQHKMLEIGCGEGRDAAPLLQRGFSLLATDISCEAIRFCKSSFPEHKDHFVKLDCLSDVLTDRFDFIYTVAVLHMLVDNTDRNRFYCFIRNHLTETGFAFVCSMGDGAVSHETDTSTAFELTPRIHAQSGITMNVATTSCRMVTFETFRREIAQNGFHIIEDGIASAGPDFPVVMYAVISLPNHELPI